MGEHAHLREQALGVQAQIQGQLIQRRFLRLERRAQIPVRLQGEHPVPEHGLIALPLKAKGPPFQKALREVRCVVRILTAQPR